MGRGRELLELGDEEGMGRLAVLVMRRGVGQDKEGGVEDN